MKRLFLMIFAICFLWNPAHAWEGSWDVDELPYVKKTAAPTVNDDSYIVPYLWVDETNDKFYLLIDNTPGAAVWTGVGVGALTSTLNLDQNVEALSGNKTLVTTDLVIQKLDPDGSDRDVTLPAEADSTDLVFYIFNMADGAGEDIVIKDDTPTTLGTLLPGMACKVTCDGTTWTMVSWVAPDVIYTDGVSGIAQFGTAAGSGQVNITPGSAINGLFINQDNAAHGVHVDHDGASGYGIYSFGAWPLRADQDGSGGSAFVAYRNIDEAGSAALVQLINDHTTDTQATLSLQNDGSGAHITTGATNEDLEIDPNGTGGVAIGGVTPVAGTTLLLPLENDAVTPTLAFGDGGEGFWQDANDKIRVSIGGTGTWSFTASDMGAYSSGRARMMSAESTSTVPGFCPDGSGDTDTGLGHAAADQLSLIAGAQEGVRLIEDNNTVVHAWDVATVTCASNVCAENTVSKFYVTTENNAAADVLTIPDGTVAGESRVVCLAVDGGDDLEITPTNLLGYTTVTLDTAGECATFGFDGTNWYLESTNGGVSS